MSLEREPGAGASAVKNAVETKRQKAVRSVCQRLARRQLAPPQKASRQHQTVAPPAERQAAAVRAGGYMAG